jgi:hypothetical protein
MFMANKEFKSIDEFIEGFTRRGPTPKNYTYDGVIWGIEFLYKGRYFRITRDADGNENEVRKIFNKTSKATIEFFEIPESQYPNACNVPLNLYLGIFDDVDDLLNNGNIDGVRLNDIISNEQTTILAID